LNVNKTNVGEWGVTQHRTEVKWKKRTRGLKAKKQLITHHHTNKQTEKKLKKKKLYKKKHENTHTHTHRTMMAKVSTNQSKKDVQMTAPANVM
jgi:hypothetical protein